MKAEPAIQLNYGPPKLPATNEDGNGAVRSECYWIRLAASKPENRRNIGHKDRVYLTRISVASKQPFEFLP